MNTVDRARNVVLVTAIAVSSVANAAPDELHHRSRPYLSEFRGQPHGHFHVARKIRPIVRHRHARQGRKTRRRRTSSSISTAWTSDLQSSMSSWSARNFSTPRNIRSAITRERWRDFVDGRAHARRRNIDASRRDETAVVEDQFLQMHAASRCSSANCAAPTRTRHSTATSSASMRASLTDSRWKSCCAYKSKP